MLERKDFRGPTARAYQGEGDEFYLEPDRRHLSKDKLMKEFPKAINDLVEARLYSVKSKNKEIKSVKYGFQKIETIAELEKDKDNTFNRDYEYRLISD